MKPRVPDDPAMVTAFGGMLLLADRTVCAEILRRLGRHVLVQRPLVEGLQDPEGEEFELAWEQHPWVDFQLLESSPEHRLLDSDDFDKYDLLLEAWPDGFDEVIFSFGEDDEQHAEAIVQTLLEHADEHSIPIKTDAACTDDELKLALRSEFVAFIRQWRARTVEMLS
jgi:hypothetical protein